MNQFCAAPKEAQTSDCCTSLEGRYIENGCKDHNTDTLTDTFMYAKKRAHMKACTQGFIY